MTGFSGFFVFGNNLLLPVKAFSPSPASGRAAPTSFPGPRASEYNNRCFSIERALDGARYTSVAFINSQAVGGNSNFILNYTFNEVNVSTKGFYRIVQTDLSGRTETSAVVVLKARRPVRFIVLRFILIPPLKALDCFWKAGLALW
ncbi:MAG: hypothetical protein WKF70_09540 [Chitinophagaceae bacterium]